MLCFAHLGAVSSYSLTGYKFIAFFFKLSLCGQQLKRRVWISRNRNEAEGQGVIINNTVNLKRRDVYLSHSSKGIVCPSRKGIVAGGTQSLAVGAYGIACLHLGRSQSRGSPVQAGLGYSSQDLSSSLSFPWARLHLKKRDIKKWHQLELKCSDACTFHFGTVVSNVNWLNSRLLWVLWRSEENISNFLNKHRTVPVTINSTRILYFKFIQILAVFIFIVSSLMSSLKQLPGVYKLWPAYKLANVKHNVEITS